jgi:hypothetical protein
MEAFEKGQVIAGARLIEPTRIEYKGRDRRQSRAAWVCEIEGEIRIIDVGNLRRRKASTARVGRRTAALRCAYRSYTFRCGRKNIYWGLTIETFAKLVALDCRYCGRPPSNSGGTRYKDIFRYNGLDRKNNKKGYTLGNIVPCCGPCNQIKSNILTYDEMLVAMQAILKFRKRRGSRRRS